MGTKLIDLTGQIFGEWTVLGLAEHKPKGMSRWLSRCSCGTERAILGSEFRRSKCPTRSCGHPPDLTGRTFGEWVVIRFYGHDKFNMRTWLCRCSCGYEGNVVTSQLLRGRSKSCGHARDLTGAKFGKWLVIRRSDPSPSGNHRWVCRCECGVEKVVADSSLIRGQSKSCGCSIDLKAIGAALSKVRTTRADDKGVPSCPCPKELGRAEARMCLRCWGLWSKFKLRPEEWLPVLEAQAGLCAVCTKPMTPGKMTHLDHCHKTYRMRMILCGNCNTLLGQAKEDPMILESAAAYLRGFNGSY